MQVIENIALITINETLVVQLLSFLVFMFVMNRMMFRPLQGIMEKREKIILDTENEIRANLAQIKKMQRELAKQEEQAKTEAAVIRLEMTRAGEEDAKQIFLAMREDIARVRQQASIEIEAEYAKARHPIEDEARAVSQLLMEQVLQRRLGLS